MALFDKIIVFRQTGVEDWQINNLLDTVVEFLEFCGLRDKIAIQYVNQTINLEKYRVTDEADKWQGYLNGLDIIHDFARFTPRYFYQFAGILLVNDRFFSIEKKRFSAGGLALQQNYVMIVHGYDSKYEMRDSKYAMRITSLHELGHIFNTQPKERTETVMFYNVHKHCANESCVMHPTRFPPDGIPIENLFCSVCQRYLKLFLEKNFE